MCVERRLPTKREGVADLRKRQISKRRVDGATGAFLFLCRWKKGRQAEIEKKKAERGESFLGEQREEEKGVANEGNMDRGSIFGCRQQKVFSITSLS